jgi:hypothetical protein
MKKITLPLLLFVALSTSLLAQPKTVGTTGADYATLKVAFDAINAGTLKGSVVLQIIDNTNESASAILNATGNGADYSSVTIYPTVTGKTISGNLPMPLIDLSGADNVTIDGRLNATGSAKDLTVVNTSTAAAVGTSTIRFINEARNNTIKYCNIKGSSTSQTSGGIVFFSTAVSTSYTLGNSNNTISDNDITSSIAGRPVNGIFSSGTASKLNSDNIISSNNIYNFLKHGTGSNGIFLSSNTTAWTISGNSFYETTSFVPTAAVLFYAIRINFNTGNGFTVSGNYIGGSAATCGGTAWTKTASNNNAFVAIYLSVGTVTASSVQNNTIKNFNWNNSLNASWTGIQIASGDVNVGGSAGNTIGAATGTGSLTITSGSTNSNVYGINITGAPIVDCQNNIIGSITAATTSSADASIISGISNLSVGASSTIANNIIGSTTSANSINASSVSTGNVQKVFGISNSGTGDVAISGNIIANLNNGTSNTGGGVAGLYFKGSQGTNTVSGNFVFNLSTISGSSTASMHGIWIDGGNAIYYNNIINLGGNTGSTIYGISESDIDFDASNIYFNTVYIGGSPASGALNSYAFYSAGDVTSWDIRNNVFDNARTNSGASGDHYAISLTGVPSIIDYNDYFVSGTGGVLGDLGGPISTLAVWKGTTGQDASSLNINPVFTNAGGTTAADYKLGVDLNGVDGTGITADYGFNSRGLTPAMGVWERIINMWKGTTNTNWGTASNWTSGVLPGIDAQIVFDAAPVNHCIMDVNRSVAGITNAQSAYRLVTNGYKLTIKGDLKFTNGAQIDASVTNSTVEFAGLSAQSIPSGAFYNNQVYFLTINNQNNVVLNGTLLLLNNLTTVSGSLDAITNSTNVSYSGPTPQTIGKDVFTNNSLYNLTIDNTSGVTLTGSVLTVSGSLTINTGKKFEIGPGNLLTVSGTITNNAGDAGFVINSDVSGDGKLINSNSSISGTVKLFLKGGLVTAGVGRFHYFVPPVGSMTIGSTIADVKTNLSLTNFNGDLASYSEVAAASNRDAGWQYFDGYDWGFGPTTPFSSLVSSKGYNFFPVLDDIITFKGTLNYADHAFSNLSFTTLGWNVVGNPYPCNYDLTGIPELTSIGDYVNNTVYFNHDGGYAYWNVQLGVGTTGYSAVIPPMQGFFVHALAAGQSLTLPASSKTAGTASPLRSKGVSDVRKIKMVLNNGIVPDETIVCLFDKATTGFDGDFDAYKLFGKAGTDVPYIYTVLGAVKYAINVVPEPTTTPLVIPVTLELKTTGTYKIDITEFENLESFKVVLKHGAVETTLGLDASYSFTLAAGTYTDFQLIITDIVTAVETQPNEKLKTWYSNNFLYINCPDDLQAEKCNLVIYDIQGKMVYNNNLVYLTPGQTNQLAVSLQKGVYITHLLSDKQRFVSKIVVF